VKANVLNVQGEKYPKVHLTFVIIVQVENFL